jgi:hypothetical protein
MCVVALSDGDLRDPFCLRDTLGMFVRGGITQHLLVDLSCVEHMSDLALAAILSARGELRARRGRMSIAGACQRVREAIAASVDDADLAAYVDVEHAERMWEFRPPARFTPRT